MELKEVIKAPGGQQWEMKAFLSTASQMPYLSSVQMERGTQAAFVCRSPYIIFYGQSGVVYGRLESGTLSLLAADADGVPVVPQRLCWKQGSHDREVFHIKVVEWGQQVFVLVCSVKFFVLYEFLSGKEILFAPKPPLMRKTIRPSFGGEAFNTWRTLMVIFEDGTVGTWRFCDGREEANQVIEPMEGDKWRAGAFSQDSTLLALGSEQGRVTFYRLGEGISSFSFSFFISRV